ncbi:MAG: phosphoribosylaminoimidazolesuccinocarboxamide synthase [Tenuifilaceae bacterium]|nr:phosphoribosylaminoimidazolesuccinocarboxamide synthase [Tenuifilaceae bacterium]
MNKAIVNTNYRFPEQTGVYKGKVRDVYSLSTDVLVMIVSDRISAFDVVLPEGIPYKGQVLNQIASKFLDATSHIVHNWKIDTPDPMVTIGHKCEPFPVEMIVRGYLTGSAWREYKNGAREISGVPIPDGMKEHQAFKYPIITPSTKAEQGEHDENISAAEILKQGLVSEEDYAKLEEYSLKLFEHGSKMANERGLILVDTKYEFGKKDDQIYLIDEVHTPDSSRYFYLEGYQDRFDRGEAQRQLSKEFVREWLMENGFMGNPGQQVPEMTSEIVKSISERYIELYEHISGEKFVKQSTANVVKRIEDNVLNSLRKNLLLA